MTELSVAAKPTAGKAAARTTAKREILSIRIKAKEKNLIDRAAKVRGKNRTEFILEAVRRAAEETILEQGLIVAGPKAYAEFVARLDLPPQPSERLRETMRATAPWEQPA